MTAVSPTVKHALPGVYRVDVNPQLNEVLRVFLFPRRAKARSLLGRAVTRFKRESFVYKPEIHFSADHIRRSKRRELTLKINVTSNDLVLYPSRKFDDEFAHYIQEKKKRNVVNLIF